MASHTTLSKEVIDSITFKASTKSASKVEYSKSTVVKAFESSCFYDQYGMYSKDKSVNKDEVIANSGKDDIVTYSGSNGLVNTVVHAYNQHHNLILRPENFWVAILTQFSLYVNANSEELRSKFVDFDGKKELVVKGIGNLYTADYAELTMKMSSQISENIKDPEVKDWLMPNFSTTTSNDKVVCSAVFMATLQKYFDYKFELCCGIPEVTLLGTVEDYELLYEKVQGLKKFDTSQGYIGKWLGHLTKVMTELIKSRKGEADINFWNRICSNYGEGSGPRYLSGWITAFCCFNENGAYIGNITSCCTNYWSGEITHSEYPIINDNDVAPGIVSVPVTVDDNGTTYKTKLLAGSIASDVLEDTLQPRLDWCLIKLN